MEPRGQARVGETHLGVASMPMSFTAGAREGARMLGRSAVWEGGLGVGGEGSKEA